MTNQKAMQLIQEAQAGDEAAFQDILRRFGGWCGRYTVIIGSRRSSTIGSTRVD